MFKFSYVTAEGYHGIVVVESASAKEARKAAIAAAEKRGHRPVSGCLEQIG